MFTRIATWVSLIALPLLSTSMPWDAKCADHTESLSLSLLLKNSWSLAVPDQALKTSLKEQLSSVLSMTSPKTWSLLRRSVRLSTAQDKSTTTWLLRDRSLEPKTLPSSGLSSSPPGLSTHLRIHSKSTRTQRSAGPKKKTKTTVFGHSPNHASATSSRLSSISNRKLATQDVTPMPLPLRAMVASTKSSSQTCSPPHSSDHSEHCRESYNLTRQLIG